jgi:hypothetical protein
MQRKDGGGLLQAVKQGCEQVAHGLQGRVIKQRSPPLPQEAFAAQFCPYRLQQGPTELLGLIHQKRQHHQRGKDNGKMLLAVIIG